MSLSRGRSSRGGGRFSPILLGRKGCATHSNHPEVFLLPVEEEVAGGVALEVEKNSVEVEVVRDESGVEDNELNKSACCCRPGDRRRGGGIATAERSMVGGPLFGVWCGDKDE